MRRYLPAVVLMTPLLGNPHQRQVFFSPIEPGTAVDRSSALGIPTNIGCTAFDRLAVYLKRGPGNNLNSLTEESGRYLESNGLNI
jgi:hypothetical protein